MKLKDIEDFVHSRGKWAAENCFRTNTFISGEIYVISNHMTYGNKSDKEIAYDSVVLKKKNGKFKICSVDIGEINAHNMSAFPFIFDIKYYREYLIDEQ